MAIQIISQHVVSRHPESGKPKYVQIAYNNGRLDMVHIHNNGQVTRSTLREGTTQVRQVVTNLNPNRSQIQITRQILYQRVISRHSITNTPKVVEVKYTNGNIVRYHYHNDGRITRCC